MINFNKLSEEQKKAARLLNVSTNAIWDEDQFLRCFIDFQQLMADNLADVVLFVETHLQHIYSCLEGTGHVTQLDISDDGYLLAKWIELPDGVMYSVRQLHDDMYAYYQANPDADEWRISRESPYDYSWAEIVDHLTEVSQKSILLSAVGESIQAADPLKPNVSVSDVSAKFQSKCAAVFNFDTFPGITNIIAETQETRGEKVRRLASMYSEMQVEVSSIKDTASNIQLCKIEIPSKMLGACTGANPAAAVASTVSANSEGIFSAIREITASVKTAFSSAVTPMVDGILNTVKGFIKSNAIAVNQNAPNDYFHVPLCTTFYPEDMSVAHLASLSSACAIKNPTLMKEEYWNTVPRYDEGLNLFSKPWRFATRFADFFVYRSGRDLDMGDGFGFQPLNRPRVQGKSPQTWQEMDLATYESIIPHATGYEIKDIPKFAALNKDVFVGYETVDVQIRTRYTHPEDVFVGRAPDFIWGNTSGYNVIASCGCRMNPDVVNGQSMYIHHAYIGQPNTSDDPFDLNNWFSFWGGDGDWTVRPITRTNVEHLPNPERWDNYSPVILDSDVLVSNDGEQRTTRKLLHCPVCHNALCQIDKIEKKAYDGELYPVKPVFDLPLGRTSNWWEWSVTPDIQDSFCYTFTPGLKWDIDSNASRNFLWIQYGYRNADGTGVPQAMKFFVELGPGDIIKAIRAHQGYRTFTVAIEDIMGYVREVPAIWETGSYPPLDQFAKSTITCRLFVGDYKATGNNYATFQNDSFRYDTFYLYDDDKLVADYQKPWFNYIPFGNFEQPMPARSYTESEQPAMHVVAFFKPCKPMNPYYNDVLPCCTPIAKNDLLFSSPYEDDITLDDWISYYENLAYGHIDDESPTDIYQGLESALKMFEATMFMRDKALSILLHSDSTYSSKPQTWMLFKYHTVTGELQNKDFVDLLRLSNDGGVTVNASMTIHNVNGISFKKSFWEFILDFVIGAQMTGYSARLDTRYPAAVVNALFTPVTEDALNSRAKYVIVTDARNAIKGATIFVAATALIAATAIGAVKLARKVKWNKIKTSRDAELRAAQKRLDELAATGGVKSKEYQQQLKATNKAKRRANKADKKLAKLGHSSKVSNPTTADVVEQELEVDPSTESITDDIQALTGRLA